MADDLTPDGGEAPEPIDRRRDLRLVLSGVVAVLLIWFALANLEDVDVHFWVVSTRSPVIAVIAISGVCGAAISALVTRFRKRT